MDSHSQYSSFRESTLEHAFMGDISQFKKAIKTTANSMGVKGERPNSYVLKRTACERLESIDDVIECLFGPLNQR